MKAKKHRKAKSRFATNADRAEPGSRIVEDLGLEIAAAATQTTRRLTKKRYEKRLEQLQTELVKLQEWIKGKGLKVVVEPAARSTR